MVSLWVLMMPTLYLFLTGPHSRHSSLESVSVVLILASVSVPLFRGLCCLAWTPIHYSNPEAYSDNNRGCRVLSAGHEPHRPLVGVPGAVWRPRLDEMSVRKPAPPGQWHEQVPSGPGTAFSLTEQGAFSWCYC